MKSNVPLPARRPPRLGFWLSVSVVLGIGLLAYTQKQALYDWYRLRNYQPPAHVVSLANDITVTDQARRIFYVNQPAIEGKEVFGTNCPNNGNEQTIVLGCYHPPQRGIYIFAVTDPQLQNVQQVTAAHELLHAAYDRLDPKERQRIDSLLQNYYQTQLSDERLKDTIAAYQKSEPNEVINEMHSIFGTEVAGLPAELETYYQRYFSDRQKIVAYAAKYQGAFTSRRNLIIQYDAQLGELKRSIDANRSQLDSLASQLNTQRRTLDALALSDPAAYNRQVDSFNAQVVAYNNLRAQTQALISQYNKLVETRNAVAIEEQNLAQSLDSRLPGQSSQSP